MSIAGITCTVVPLRLRRQRGASLTAPLPLSQGKKVLQDTPSPVLTFLRVKLRGIQVIPPQYRSKIHSVVRRGDDYRSVLGRSVVRMHEVREGPVGDASQERTGPLLV